MWRDERSSLAARSPTVHSSRPGSGKFGDAMVAGLSPGCFAFVMATGIVSVAAHFRGWRWLAWGLFGFNAVAYFTLSVLTVLRLARFPAQFIGDLGRHSRAPGFLTMPAGTCVLGCQFALLTPWPSVARILWCAGGALWMALIYGFFVGVVVSAAKPSLAAGISGSWLLVVVATQSVSVLGSLVARAPGSGRSVLFLSLAAYFLGAMFYLFLATLILYRWLFFRLDPEQLTPDYWINMGALAISTLAGSLLTQEAGRWELLRRLEPVLAGSALFFWATCTWWIPLLVILGLWRHVLRGVPWNYGPGYWSLVFPLGMYAVATDAFYDVVSLPFLKPIAAAFTWIAPLVWAVVVGCVRKRP